MRTFLILSALALVIGSANAATVTCPAAHIKYIGGTFSMNGWGGSGSNAKPGTYIIAGTNVDVGGGQGTCIYTQNGQIPTSSSTPMLLLFYPQTLKADGSNWHVSPGDNSIKYCIEDGTIGECLFATV